MLQQISVHLEFFSDHKMINSQIPHMIKLLCEVQKALAKYGDLPAHVTRDIIPEELKLNRTTYSRGVHQCILLRDYIDTLCAIIKFFDRNGKVRGSVFSK
ncbi:unnamed protein product [Ceutorhynchus assimilis]|uniref:Uncharacterized protein n=1 Tax=Ceutorhynchus assimilis TaxID=467358 RepID=A0A9N9MQ15_9CUCU|nr:unnamed protein product [Ceutorhynchus assimilis]